MQVFSWEYDNLSMPEQFLEYSKAYMYSAKVLCQNLIDTPQDLTYAKGCSCMFNARLSVELFLKSALLNKAQGTRLNHGIEWMADEYHKLYPEEKFSWDVPFRLQAIGFDDDEIENAVKRHLEKQPQDQMLRYPINNKKEPWEGAGSFSPDEFITLPNRIELDMEKLERLILG